MIHGNQPLTNISIHAPREGGDMGLATTSMAGTLFQSTPPARGATAAYAAGSVLQLYFNPRPPRGGRRGSGLIQAFLILISIHAPREGGDERDLDGDVYRDISIHAPREGGDVSGTTAKWCGRISIHAPREGGDSTSATVAALSGSFQSTPPARGATSGIKAMASAIKISIHAPREGGDPSFV